MPDPFFLMVYALGFVGLAAISLIPLRSWFLLRPFFGRHSSSSVKAVPVLIGVLAGLTLVFEAKIVFRVFYCLIGEYCGPSVAHGWIFLAMLGTAYLAFEAAVAVVSVVARLASRSAA
jgi:hypothetical protein